MNAVVNGGGHYRLADFLDVDVRIFTEALINATPHSPDRESLLRTAVALHVGHLADQPNADFTWLQPHRRRFDRRGVQARIALAEIIQDREPVQAVALLRQASRYESGDAGARQRISDMLGKLQP
ncbi:hypothetical protein KIH74_34150 [Kineosporia sp. J2-2]|uniref:Uncharacterized protein n=1 Tax=Kineosporia corallincola TaxID=2835133 RepID=A0ABS5TTC7_9ACTN|nr:hypothetical protein [Kineosporia corallincola]MBT0774038.1 hypothetical protein [Kineosporia corallincola]